MKIKWYNKVYINVVILTCTVFIIFSPGVAPNIITLWNLMPIGVFYLLYFFALKNGSASAICGSIGFAIAGIGLSILIHAAWFFNLGDTATGSSTSGLIFLGIPIYAIILGTIGYVIGRKIGKIKNKV